MATLKTFDAAPVLEMESILGEGPMWHSIHQVLYWVDIESKIVHAWEPHTLLHREWSVGKRVGTLSATTSGTLLLALQGEIAEFDPVTEHIRKISDIERELPENRCNDGKCDPAGRFWVGTMHLKATPGSGSLYCIDHSLKVHKALSGLTIANGMAWSSNGEHMYFIDSAANEVKQYSFRKDRVSLGDKKIILRFDQKPDGMCVDSEGMLWIGFWGGSRIGCYDPGSGEHLADVRVPAPHVTSCCFGDQDLQTLYITTARTGLTEQQLKDYPLSGSLFSCRTSVVGSDSYAFVQKPLPMDANP